VKLKSTYHLCLLHILFLLVFASCNNNLDYNFANQISVNDKGQIEVIGVSEKSSKKKFIKSPYIMLLDTNLNTKTRPFYKTAATAKNPKLSKSKDGNHILSFYKSVSLNYAIETTNYKILNDRYKFKKTHQFGKRTRFVKYIESPNTSVSLVYQRATGKTEFIIEGTSNTKFKINEEPCICGVQNGLKYSDGYRFKEKTASGFIGEINEQAEITNQVIHPHDQHLFYEHLEFLKEGSLITGTKQHTNSSMDVLLVSYDDQLSIVREKAFLKEGIQYGVKSIQYENEIYTLYTSENPDNNKLNISLMKCDLSFNRIWEKNFYNNSSHTPTDFMIHDQQIYCLNNSVTEKGKSSQAKVMVISLDGELLSEKFIH